MKVCFKVDRIFFLLFFSFSLIDLQAEVLLPSLISDNMVLKQKSKVALWGWDTPGTNVQVETGWNGKVYKAVAGTDGKWSLNVSTPKAGGPFQIWIDGTNRVTLDNVMVGEVWFTSGQSNMGWSVAEEKNSENVLKNAKHDNIRLFHVPRQVSDRKEMKLRKQASWKSCDAKSVKHFSAMSYYFAVLLQEKLNVPVGIISASWAGTGIESWLSYDLQESDSKLRKSIERWDAWERAYSKDSAMYAEKMLVWQKDTARGIVNKPVKKPKSVHMLERPHCKPGALYNGMVYPCMPYTISGLIWYQGENSVEWADEYEYQLQNFIDSWRNGFRSDFPVLIGQLTNFNYPSAERAAIVRDAQLKAGEKDNTYVICTIEIGNPDDVHPNNKVPFGERFAGAALNKVYGKAGLADYPIAEGAIKKGSEVVVKFKYAKGLWVKGDALNDVSVYDANGHKMDVKTRIERNKLIIYGDNVRNAVKVSYAVDNDVKANLYNGDNLPAFPFTLSIKQ